MARCHVSAESLHWRLHDCCPRLRRSDRLLHCHFGGCGRLRWKCSARSLQGRSGFLRDKSETAARWRSEPAPGRPELGAFGVPAGFRLLAILHQDIAVRPVPGSACEAADGWVNAQLSDATFLEYAIAEEMPDEPQEDEAEPAQNLVSTLRARVRQLEAAQEAARTTPAPPRGQRQTRSLLDDVPGTGAALTAEDWRKLRAAAAAPPARLAGHERAPRTALENDELAEEELEAGELQPAVPGSEALLKLLSMQAQLLERLSNPQSQQGALAAALAPGPVATVCPAVAPEPGALPRETLT